jgi:phosphatidylserine/phosphatidylglycerophosphate/cardiolipin synthase-like enzyme
VSSRQFLQSAADARNSTRELLQFMFASELLAPSRCLWIVSPWLRDIPVLDNRTGAFAAIGAELPRSEVRLSRVLLSLIERGTRVVIATRPEEGNRQVRDALLEGTNEEGMVRFREDRELHAKGIVGDHFALLGSMNFTYNGIEYLTEMLLFQTERARIEETRIQFAQQYGGLE